MKKFMAVLTIIAMVGTVLATSVRAEETKNTSCIMSDFPRIPASVINGLGETEITKPEVLDI